MEECMICYEVNTPYQMKGCKHSICTTCAGKLQELPACVKHPFSNKVTVMLPVQDHIIKCPYCTVAEPSSYNIEELRKWYPHAYRVWVEAEMRYNPKIGITYLAFADQVKYFECKRRTIKISYHIFDENEIIDEIGELRPLKIKYIDPFAKFQLRERKLRHIQRRPKHF